MLGRVRANLLILLAAAVLVGSSLMWFIGYPSTSRPLKPRPRPDPDAARKDTSASTLGDGVGTRANTIGDRLPPVRSTKLPDLGSDIVFAPGLSLPAECRLTAQEVERAQFLFKLVSHLEEVPGCALAKDALREIEALFRAAYDRLDEGLLVLGESERRRRRGAQSAIDEFLQQLRNSPHAPDNLWRDYISNLQSQDKTPAEVSIEHARFRQQGFEAALESIRRSPDVRERYVLISDGWNQRKFSAGDIQRLSVAFRQSAGLVEAALVIDGLARITGADPTHALMEILRDSSSVEVQLLAARAIERRLSLDGNRAASVVLDPTEVEKLISISRDSSDPLLVRPLVGVLYKIGGMPGREVVFSALSSDPEELWVNDFITDHRMRGLDGAERQFLARMAEEHPSELVRATAWEALFLGAEAGPARDMMMSRLQDRNADLRRPLECLSRDTRFPGDPDLTRTIQDLRDWAVRSNPRLVEKCDYALRALDPSASVRPDADDEEIDRLIKEGK